MVFFYSKKNWLNTRLIKYFISNRWQNWKMRSILVEMSTHSRNGDIEIIVGDRKSLAFCGIFTPFPINYSQKKIQRHESNTRIEAIRNNNKHSILSFKLWSKVKRAKGMRRRNRIERNPFQSKLPYSKFSLQTIDVSVFLCGSQMLYVCVYLDLKSVWA